MRYLSDSEINVISAAATQTIVVDPSHKQAQMDFVSDCVGMGTMGAIIGFCYNQANYSNPVKGALAGFGIGAFLIPIALLTAGAVVQTVYRGLGLID